MNSHEIVVSKDLSIEGWSVFLNTNRIDSLPFIPDYVLINLSELNFIYPFHLTSLSCLIEEYFLNGVKVLFNSENIDSKVKNYLDNIKFFEYWGEHFDRNNYTHTKINTTLCLWKINYEMIDMYANTATRYFKDNHLSSKNLSELHIAVAEVLNNINDHSMSDVTGYIITQYYPQNRELILSVCDFGVGIPFSVRKYLSKTSNNGGVDLKDSELLLKALEDGFTTQTTPKNRGFGLSTIDKMSQEIESDFLIVSNNGCYRRQKVKPKSYQLENELRGTIIVVKFNVNNMGEAEDDVENDVYNL